MVLVEEISSFKDEISSSYQHEEEGEEFNKILNYVFSAIENLFSDEEKKISINYGEDWELACEEILDKCLNTFQNGDEKENILRFLKNTSSLSSHLKGFQVGHDVFPFKDSSLFQKTSEYAYFAFNSSSPYFGYGYQIPFSALKYIILTNDSFSVDLKPLSSFHEMRKTLNQKIKNFSNSFTLSSSPSNNTLIKPFSLFLPPQQKNVILSKQQSSFSLPPPKEIQNFHPQQMLNRRRKRSGFFDLDEISFEDVLTAFWFGLTITFGIIVGVFIIIKLFLRMKNLR